MCLTTLEVNFPDQAELMSVCTCIYLHPGTGKTTLLNVLAGRLVNVTGQMTVNNHPINKQIRRKLGYVLQQNVFLENLTVKETFQVGHCLSFLNKICMSSRTLELKKLETDACSPLLDCFQFAVQLWSPESLRNGQLQTKIDQAMEAFNLQKCMNSSRFGDNWTFPELACVETKRARACVCGRSCSTPTAKQTSAHSAQSQM